MVLQFNVDLHFLGPLLEVIEGMQEDLHLFGRPLREHSSSDDSDHDSLRSAHLADSTVILGEGRGNAV